MRNLTHERLLALVAALIFAPGGASSVAAGDALFQVGVAKIDVTPDYPIRLSGYGNRRSESDGVAQRIWAKALAIGDKNDLAVLITVDNCGVPASITEEVAQRLNNKAGVRRERVAVCSSHTHSAPMLSGILPNLFSSDIAREQQATIDRYTKELTAHLEQAALAAVADGRPAKLAWAEGRVKFAANRRTKGGPVDHALPVLRVTDPEGKLRAVWISYACHCTTLGGEFNQIHSDWAGYAQESIERNQPGAVALVAIGCGADANPTPRGTPDHAKQYGEEIAVEVNRLLGRTFTPLSTKLECRVKRIDLPFQPLPTREQWEERAKKPGIVGYHAKKNLARLDRGEKLPTKLPYTVQTWNFGNELALVFLPGEVVVDYSLRLKKEFDVTRLWVNGYANDVPCYIPSRRILQEGGYEAEDSLWYYDRPARLAPETEDLIIGAVHEITPREFAFDKQRAEFPPPKSPAEALAAFRTKADLTIELVAAEPLVVDPVAIDFGADGKLWVVEMHDYPTGLDGNWKRGGRVKYLEDTDADGRYDKATLFLDDLPFPTGIMAWRKGVLVCAAPDILYAEDTNGDGKADVVKKLFSGFATHNFQARVNCLRWGLDGWVYGAAGLFGAKIRSDMTGSVIELSGRDFRINPDTAEFEPVSGLSQQGRVRDDFGNWFGCDNSTLLWHFPLADHYVKRNPHVTTPNPRVFVPKDSDPNQLYPASHTLERFNDPGHANRVTSACGVEIYRDELLGKKYYGNAFVCEPVHNLVHRLVLQPQGVAFAGYRATDEQRSEFLASTDNWFRPVEARTGPDGALWIVDMYRFVIEHPRWIPSERLAKLDVRAGDDKGRIYRVYPRGKTLRPIRDLTKLDATRLAEAIDTPNGTTRDLAHRLVVDRAMAAGATPVPVLSAISTNSPIPAARVQALFALEQIRALSPQLLSNALASSDPRVRRQAVRMCEPLLAAIGKVDVPLGSDLRSELAKLVEDADPTVRFQLGLTLGEGKELAVGEWLGRLAKTGLQDSWQRAAVLSSATGHVPEILRAILNASPDLPERGEMIGSLVTTAAKSGAERVLSQVLELVLPLPDRTVQTWHLTALSSLAGTGAESGLTSNNAARVSRVFVEARQMASDANYPEDKREAAIRLLGSRGDQEDIQNDLVDFLKLPLTQRLQQATLDSLRRNKNPRLPTLVFANWPRYAPSLRAALIDLLLSREQWGNVLLNEVEKGSVSPAEISPANRQRLLNHPNADIQKRAAILLARGRMESRAEVLAKYQSVAALKGEAAKGALGFEKNCSSCHFFRGRGFAVGPDLAAFRNKSAEDFVVAVLDPSAAIEPRFINYHVETKDGRSLSGVVSGETATSLTLVQGGGVSERILRSDISEIKASSLSLMPDGLEQGIGPQDLADLIAYLKSGRPANFGSASVEAAEIARRQFIADGVNGLGKMIFASEQLSYPSWLGTLPMSHCRQTDGQSKLVWQTAPVPSDLLTNSMHRFRLAAAMGFHSQPAGKFKLRLNGKTLLEFDVTLQDKTWQSDDGKARMTYTVMENNAEDSDGPLVIEVAASLLHPGKPETFEIVGAPSNSQRWFGIYFVPE